MGRKKSPVTRKRIGRRYVEPPASSSSSSASEASSLLGDVSPTSLRGLAAIKQEPAAMDMESSSDSLQLPGPALRSLHTALPIGAEAQRGRRPRRKRRSSGDDAVVSRRDENDSSDEEQEQEEVVTISMAELEKWQQRVILHVEDHFTMQEAKQYVSNMEIQLRNQLEEERTTLRAQAEEYVAKANAKNESLRQQVKELEQQVEGLEKQVSTLENKVEALNSEKAQDNQRLDEKRLGCREQLQQTHSPLNHRTQVQPGAGEVNGSIENLPTNEGHQSNGHKVGGEAESHPRSTVKEIFGGSKILCSQSKTSTSTPHCDSSLGNDQLQQSSNTDSHPSDQTQSRSDVVDHDCLQVIEPSESPSSTGK
ncbi:unnamed protein product [Phytophthora lilii]|uniref:Unnamed protein product n=1 Tax=Phytophthora lilii TaxID=2077276 RepID=A0A9W6X731_9STRA|nr:unnamed protein product [Phytophthora lilii]